MKNCHFVRTPGLAAFPDCVAARSLKHLRELETMIAEGDRAAVLFVVQRADCDAFSACRDLDVMVWTTSTHPGSLMCRR